MSNLLSGITSQIRGSSSRPDRSPTPTGADGSSNPPADRPVVSERSSSLSRESTTIGASGAPSSELDIARPLPLWLSPAHAKHIVKGNFLLLSNRPKTVEQGEWVAHQAVEHYRNLWNFVRIVHEKEENGAILCNPRTCPKMSAGPNHSYTWLNRNQEPVEIPAYDYMLLMQRWVSSKTDDTRLFPTDPTGVSHSQPPESTSGSGLSTNGQDEWLGARSGFPQQFNSTCHLIFHQIFRVYAHLYWAHYVEPFYHLNLEKQLNSCFSHFILTATTLDMLSPADMEPMKDLIDLWAADGTFPQESRAYRYADLERGKKILALGTSR